MSVVPATSKFVGDLKNKLKKEGERIWGHGSSGRALAQQTQGSEFNL
jgi:hypothetical protein